MKLGDIIPDLKFETDQQKVDSLYNYVGDKWLMIFSHPADFTPVCTTELSQLVKLADEFKNRNVTILAVSIDSAETHRQWAKDINAVAQVSGSETLPFEIIADEDRSICTSLGMIDPDEINPHGIALSARAVMLFGPDRRLKSKILYPATFGRNFNEILRMVDGVQLGASAPVATPANWQPGDEVLAQPSLSMEDVVKKLCGGDEKKCTVSDLPSGKKYFRIISGDAYIDKNQE